MYHIKDVNTSDIHVTTCYMFGHVITSRLQTTIILII